MLSEKLQFWIFVTNFGFGAILDFWIFVTDYEGVRPLRKSVSEGNDPKCVGSFLRNHFIS